MSWIGQNDWSQNILLKINTIKFEFSTLKLVYMHFFSQIGQVVEDDPRGDVAHLTPVMGAQNIFWKKLMSYLNSAHSN